MVVEEDLSQVPISIYVPNFSFNNGALTLSFSGDDKLVLYEKTFLSRMKLTVLCEAEGGVRSIAWVGHFVAWASDTGVRVYDLHARCSLGLIKWSRSAE